MANMCFLYSIPDGKSVLGLVSEIDDCLTRENMSTQRLTDEQANFQI